VRPIKKMDFRVFQHATEHPDKVGLALRFVSGTDTVSSSKAEGYYGNPIVILETSIGNRKELEDFWERAGAAGLYAGVEENLEERINEEGVLHIRFDKQKAVGGVLCLSAGDDVVLARGRVLTRVKGQDIRASRDSAIVEMRTFLRGKMSPSGDGPRTIEDSDS
jgi:RNA-binding protein